MAGGGAVIAALILSTHALAALLLSVAALTAWRCKRRAMAGALAMTALWALAVAGMNGRDIGIDLITAARNGGWLLVLAMLARRSERAHPSLALLYSVIGAVMTLTALVAIAARTASNQQAMATLGDVQAALVMLGATGALLLLQQTVNLSRASTTRVLAIALGAMWSMDLAVAATDLMTFSARPALTIIRGVAMIAVAILFLAGPPDEAAPGVSRVVAARMIAVTALLIYTGGTAIVAYLVGSVAGDHARVAQTAVVIGSATTLLTLVSTPWLRAWFRVIIAKHLFRHRYDYRIEWQRFTATLGATGEQALPLTTRTIKALADLVDAPGGLLLFADGDELMVGDQWNWLGASSDGAEALALHLLATGRIVALSEVTGEEAACLPEWLHADPKAWIVIPLLHADVLVGAVVLARPPVQRPLDWEDLDLLRVSGRQAASFLAEDRARVALDEARRFEEFNRRFAFLLHDIKNVASQLTLVTRNAERHAHNPEFREDMVATLRDSAGRLATLLTRLGQHDGAKPEPSQPMDVSSLLTRAAAAQRAQHAVIFSPTAVPLVTAQSGRLEQVIGHLIQNAIEASTAGTPVGLSVGQVGETVEIVVADEGIGMTPAFVRDELFRPFASTKPGGFGIGAHEARQMVRSMGGALEVESRPSEGTRFRILLPIAAVLEDAA